MGISERKDRERRQMREAVLDAAMKLFVEEGYENVSIRRIAERIEYSPATIYLYFKDKDDILFALHKLAFGKLNEAQAGTQSVKDPLKRLRKHGETYVRFGLENPELYDLMFIMRAPARKIMQEAEWEIGMRGYELLKKNVRDCMEAGLIRSTRSVDSIAFALWSFVHGIVSLNIRDRCAMIPPARRRALVKSALLFIDDAVKSTA